MLFTKAYGSIHQQTVHFSPGFYTTNDVIKKINVLISKDHGDIKVDSHTGKIRMSTGPFSHRMSPSLYNFFGYDFVPKPENGAFEKSTTYKGYTLFFYCDTLAPRIVGDTNTSLLVTLPSQNKHLTFRDTITTKNPVLHCRKALISHNTR